MRAVSRERMNQPGKARVMDVTNSKGLLRQSRLQDGEGDHALMSQANGCKLVLPVEPSYFFFSESIFPAGKN